MKLINLYFIFILAVLSTQLQGQYLANPSFEGTPGISLSPPDWIPYNTNSTPDTEPINCDYYIASEGDTYLTLVVRGEESTFPNTIENCQTELLQPLLAGFCYSLSVDLASRDDVGHYIIGEGFITYLSSVTLKIYASNSDSDKGELLVETSEISNQEWETFSISIKPQEEISYIILEIGHFGGSSGLGNLLIDNLIISSEEIISTVQLNETYQTSDLPITITASESDSYSWSPSTGLSCYDCQSPDVNTSISRTYSCLITNSIGCPTEELFILNFPFDPFNPLTPEFKIPNVFTPNGDGFNDYFEIPGLPPYSSLIIFNRSGKQLYKSEQYNNDWNGIDMENNELPEGVYWYILITPGFSGKHNGSVYLKRKQ